MWQDIQNRSDGVSKWIVWLFSPPSCISNFKNIFEVKFLLLIQFHYSDSICTKQHFRALCGFPSQFTTKENTGVLSRIFFNNNGIQPCKSINPFLGLPYKSTHKVATQQLASLWPNLMATSQDPEVGVFACLQ